MAADLNWKYNYTDEDSFLQTYDYDATNYLSDLELFEGNFFWAGNFGSGSDASKNMIKREFDNAQFRIKAVTLPNVSLNIVDDTVLNRGFFTGITRTKTISITWIEDAYMSVSKYHHDWLSNWYDLAHDCFMTGIDGKYRMLDLYLYHYTSTSMFTPEKAQYIAKIELRGLVPQNISYPNFDHSGTGEYTRQITYTVGQCNIIYNPVFTSGMKANDVFNDKSKVAKGVWTPEPETAGMGGSSEAHRLAHSMVVDINSEGMLS